MIAVAIAWSAWVPVASAAAPSNDDFADREVLSGSLPIAVERSNVDATKEVGEPSFNPFSANGNSVWFEWEAPGAGFVTVSTCGSTFSPVLGVYTGTALGALTEVAGDFSSQGPECPAYEGAAVTFKATAGATYAILVDSLSAAFGTGGGQGSFPLGIDATPVPANDDFADAAVLTGDSLKYGIYTAYADGFTWNATKEAGEPQHAGNPGGASIWYSWTAPFSDYFGVGGCGRFETLAAVYTGDSVDDLSLVAFGNQSCLTSFWATAGTTYRIAIDGLFAAGSGAAAMGTTWVNVWEGDPAGPPVDTPSLSSINTSAPRMPARSAPDTTIRKRTVKPAKRTATFAFGSSEVGSTFQCRLDSRPFAACASPSSFSNLKRGRHEFEVAAVDAAGSKDPTPAVAVFKISRPKHHKVKSP